MNSNMMDRAHKARTRKERKRDLRAQYAGAIMGGKLARGKGMLSNTEAAREAVDAANALADKVIACEDQEDG